tara:strand:+ start:2990 stop:3259 length:270 start_codon:yes stop_codon:yes gene_type:complete
MSKTNKYHNEIVDILSNSVMEIPLSRVFGHKSDEALRLHCAEQRIEVLEEAVKEAHRIILHEMDNGRTPTMLKAEHGGKGLGYFEDLIK